MTTRGLFRLSEAVALSFHAAAILAECPDGLVSVKQLADELQASENHLSKVMQRLSRAGLVESTRGPGGGFRLSRKTSELRLLDIYEAIEGKLESSGCLFDRPVCDGRFCILGNLIVRLEAEAKGYFEGTSLADVVQRRRGK